MIAVRGLLITALGLSAVAAIMLLSQRASGKYILAVQSASMMPAFARGDALIISKIRPTDLKVGDIISYQSPIDPAVLISHRLLEIDKQTDKLTTAGDASHEPDTALEPEQVVGRATAVALKLGLVLDALRHPLGLALAVYLPALAITFTEIQHLSRHYARPYYSVKL